MRPVRALGRWPKPGPPAVAFAAMLAAGLLVPELQRLALYSGEAFLDIRLGIEMLLARGLPDTDHLSWTHFGEPYILHEWGFQLLMTLFYHLFSIDGIILLTALFGAATVALVVDRLRSRQLDAPAALLTLVLCLPCFEIGYRGRPQLASFLFFALLLKGLSSRRLRAWPAWQLAAASFGFFLVWACLHPGALLGLGALALAALSLFAADRRLAGRALAATTAAAAGFCATPYGLQLPMTAGRMLFWSELRRSAVEWWPLSLASWPGAMLVILGALSLACFILTRERNRAYETWEPALAAALFAAALQGRRLNPFFAIAAAPYAAWTVEQGIALLTARFRRRLGSAPRLRLVASDPPAAGRGLILAATACAFAVVALTRGALSRETFYTLTQHPIAAADWIKHHSDILGPAMYNNPNFGNYLTFALPDRKVFVDSRVELYGPAFYREQVAIVNGDPAAARKFADWKIDWAIFHSGSPLSDRLAMADWRLVYVDRIATIYLKPKR